MVGHGSASDREIEVLKSAAAALPVGLYLARRALSPVHPYFMPRMLQAQLRFHELSVSDLRLRDISEVCGEWMHRLNHANMQARMARMDGWVHAATCGVQAACGLYAEDKGPIQLSRCKPARHQGSLPTLPPTFDSTNEPAVVGSTPVAIKGFPIPPN